MSLRLVCLVTLGVFSAATDVAADFEKACQAGSSECVDNSEDMYLIQKHVEVGSAALEAKENQTSIPDKLKKAKNDIEKAEKKLAEARSGGEQKVALGAKGAKEAVKGAKAAAKKAKGGGDVVTTKGGGGDDADTPVCPDGYTAEPGYTPEDKVFSEAGDSVASDKDACASDCSNHSACGSFQFANSKCYLMTRASPYTEFPDTDGDMKDALFCSKDNNCTFVWPWAYYNETDSVEGNVWNAWNTVHRCWVTLLVWCLVTWFIWVLLGVLAWKTCCSPIPEILEDPADPVYTFEAGHFDCCRRPSICFFSFCCPHIQWALTMDLAGFLHVGTAFGIFCVCGLLNAVLMYTTLFFPGLITVILMMVYRQKLRRKLQRAPDVGTSYFNDFCFLLCCPWCAVAQEAMVVQYAYSRSQGDKGVERVPVASMRVPATAPIVRPGTVNNARAI
jgi:Cys-rich protein (TIGR01571 family)